MTQEQYIDRACRWLVEHSHNSDTQEGITCTPVMTEGTLIEDFRKAMTEKTNSIFEKCLTNVNPETRAEVRKNMDATCSTCERPLSIERKKVTLSIKDVQIDDWVKIGDADKYHGYVGKIRAINSITGYCIVGIKIGDDTFVNSDVYIDDIEPILVTDQLMERNGFPLDEERPTKRYRLWLGEWYEDGHVSVAFHKFTSGPQTTLSIETIPPHASAAITLTIEYVHELQRMLKICKLNSLAQNFKV